MFSHPIPGVCEGCGARRTFVTIMHDSGTDAGSSILIVTVPHYLCDGVSVLSANLPDGPEADPDDSSAGGDSPAVEGLRKREDQ